MASSRCTRIALLLLALMTRGVSARAVDFGSKPGEEASGADLRTDALRRWRIGGGGAETHRDCMSGPSAPGASQGPVFPGKSLFSFVRRVYRCCQEGISCRSVKGIQGRLRGDVEFLLTREISSLTLLRAELHLQLSNPQHLDVHPVLSSMAKRGLPTRYSLWSRGNTVELRVDLLFLLQSLQEAAGGADGGPGLVNMRRVVFSSLQDTDGAGALPALDLGLVLGCSRDGSGVSCGAGGVHLSHTPFMALFYQ
uniref:Uncharacterized protein n=1 Tax=Dicentrarchus labrax TaxID=13489 RepID=A0A8C4F640_DICLA